MSQITSENPYVVREGYNSRKTGNFYVYIGTDIDGNVVFYSDFHKDLKIISLRRARKEFGMKNGCGPTNNDEEYEEGVVWASGETTMEDPNDKSKGRSFDAQLTEGSTGGEGPNVQIHCREGIYIVIERYGEMSSDPGHGSIIYIEQYEGKAWLTVWADINREDPTHRIDLSGALESNRKEL